MEDLIIQCYNKYLNGDETGIEQIVEKFGENLVYYVFNYTNNYEDAEDIMMDTFAIVLSKKHYLKNQKAFKTYLYKIARNKAIDFVRKHKKILFAQDFVDNVEDINHFEKNLIKNEKQNQILHHIYSLPKAYKEVVLLHFFEELSYEQIAIILHKNKKQIYNIISRAKIILKQKLKTEVYDENN